VPRTHPTLTLLVPNFGDLLDDWRSLIDVARAAEAAGVDRLQVVDHLVMGPRPEAYSWGRFPTTSDAPWLEPLAVLATVAGATERIRLSTGILVAALRPAAVLAKTAATIDVLSGGRLDLGVGTGWQSEEYDAVGLPFAERGRLLDEVLAACQQLWTAGPATIEVAGARVPDLWCRPAPVQRGGVPLWIGGTLHRRNLERVARFGSGWLPIMGASLDDVAGGCNAIAEALDGAGRTMEGFEVQVPLPMAVVEGKLSLPASLEQVPAVLAAGATDVMVSLRALTKDPLDCEAPLRDLVTAFRAVAA
jgi:probable F420-dependent oxidoreductase